MSHDLLDTRALPLIPAPAESIAGLARPAAGLWKLRWRLLRNNVADKINSSRLRLSMIVFFSFVFWAGLFALFLEGFNFLSRHHLLSGPLSEMLFGLFFGSLLVMLVFSTGIILYAGLFASAEAQFLLVRPIPPDLVFAFKFQEAMFFSCWGFLLLGSPMMVAYGLMASAPWSFYGLSLLFFMAFAFIPGSIGALICLLITNFIPRRKQELFIASIATIVVVILVYGFRIWQLSRDTVLTRSWLNNLVGQLKLSNLPFLPSQWISKGLLAATYPDGWRDAVFYLLLLVSNALFIYMMAALGYRHLYRRGYNQAHSYNFARRKRARSLLPGIIDQLFAPLSGQMRVLILKDVRTFMRDPVQWSQVLIFTGLLVFYFITLGRMNYYTENPYWRNLIGFFNLSVTGLILSTFTSRFIFPLLSLEGQKFWILGLCPMSREQILWGKFAFASGGAILVTFTLTLLSAAMLRLEPMLVVLQLITVLILCFGISGISVGLGARFPEMTETDPSKIAAGFGGTLNLVASLLFILVVITTMAFPCYLYSVTQAIEQGASNGELGDKVAGISLASFRWWLALSILGSIGIGAAATWIPMRLGIRSFCAKEF